MRGRRRSARQLAAQLVDQREREIGERHDAGEPGRLGRDAAPARGAGSRQLGDRGVERTAASRVAVATRQKPCRRSRRRRPCRPRMLEVGGIDRRGVGAGRAAGWSSLRLTHAVIAE